MQHEEIVRCLAACRRYREAKSWQKPWLDPARFLRNQIRRRGLIRAPVGALRTAPTFFLDEFTIVNGEGVSEQIAAYGVYEPDLSEAFCRLIRPGEQVVDIGMHLGYYTTLFACLVGDRGLVHAFEPTPTTREIAHCNVGRYPQVTVHPFAVWSGEGAMTFRDFGPQWMAFNSLRDARIKQGPPAPRLIEVPTISLDRFRRDLGRSISLIKIDAESAEQEILRGAVNLLAQDRPIVSVEVGDTEGLPASRPLIEEMVDRGFTPWELTGGGFRPHQPRAAYEYGNLIFVPAGTDLSRV